MENMAVIVLKFVYAIIYLLNIQWSFKELNELGEKWGIGLKFKI